VKHLELLQKQVLCSVRLILSILDYTLTLGPYFFLSVIKNLFMADRPIKINMRLVELRPGFLNTLHKALAIRAVIVDAIQGRLQFHLVHTLDHLVFE
jgi:hypothetical protein